MDISKKTTRSKLAARREPYWTQIGTGAYIGYRAGADTWIARFRGKDGKQQYRSLGAFEEYSDAKSGAEKWIAQMSGGAHRKVARGTVRSALAKYLRHLRSVGRRKTAWEVGQRFRITVPRDGDIGNMRLEDVQVDDVEDWRKGLRKGRKPRSVNRQFRAVHAAIRFAISKGHIGKLAAWDLDALVDDDEDSVMVSLTADHRERLIAHSTPALAALLRGYAHTGARPSELANAVVKDFDASSGTVTLRHRKGKKANLKARAVTLADDAVEFFREQARDKLPRAPLICAEDGASHWRDVDWSVSIRAAASAANAAAKTPSERVPPGVSAYSFRHSRISELLQLYGIDPVTVATQCGTSTLMIERFYYKAIPDSIRDKLNALRDKPVTKAAS